MIEHRIAKRVHAENISVTSSSDRLAVIIDWQLSGRGIAVHAISHILVENLSIRPGLEEKSWAFITNIGYRFGGNSDSGIQRNTQVELNKMVPRGGFEPPTHGFSVS